MEIISFSVSNINQWNLLAQSLIIVSFLSIAIISTFSDRLQVKNTLLVFASLLSVFALYHGFYKSGSYGRDPIIFAFFGIWAICFFILRKRNFSTLILKSVLVISSIILSIIIWYFGVFKNVFFDNQIFINRPFRLYFNWYTQWGTFIVVMIFFAVFYFRKPSNLPTKIKCTRILALILILFWTTFFVVKILNGKTVNNRFAFDSITKNVKYGIGANAVNKYGETKLFKAIEDNNLEEVKNLVKDGADVNISGGNVVLGGKTPLNRAVRLQHYEIATLLIENAANINLLDEDGVPPIHMITRYGNKDKEFLYYMINKGVILSQNNKYGFQAIHKISSVRPIRLEEELNNTDEFIKILVENGVNVNAIAIDHAHNTPLHFAAQANNLKNIKVLIELGANPMIKDKYNRNPRELAVSLQQTMLKSSYNTDLDSQKRESIIKFLEESEKKYRGRLTQ